jgi:hypothetical protein
MKRVLLRSIVIAMTLTVVGWLVSVLLFARMMVVSDSFDQAKQELMTYRDAMEYSRANMRSVSGVSYLIEAFKEPGLLTLGLEQFGVTFLLLVFAGVWSGLWQRRLDSAVERRHAADETRGGW